MKNTNNILIKGFHCANLILIIFYLYPGSVLGYVLYSDTSIQPQITRNFLISSNHFYAFIVLSIIGILAYRNTRKINFLINYLFLSSIVLEFFHIYIPNRSFEVSDLFGNIMGVVVVFVSYKIKQKYE
ncbi:VanZ family protein [Candidatus Pelagibacter sp.]|jgi:VanZ family protein|nr:VanZ family protein [Candidatus Pelagibacter sp.]|tara:strand:+ start:70 stop:453 length:384 start_codon:yes stop_codon:yes gene_type:complete